MEKQDYKALRATRVIKASKAGLARADLEVLPFHLFFLLSLQRNDDLRLYRPSGSERQHRIPWLRRRTRTCGRHCML